MTWWTTISDMFRVYIVMSLTGSSVALLLFILKPLIRYRLPKSVQYYSWLIVIATYLIPFSLFISVPPSIGITPLISDIVNENVVSGFEYQEREMILNTGYSSFLADEEVLQMSDEELSSVLRTIYETSRKKDIMNGFMLQLPIYGFIAVLFTTILENGIFVRKLRKRSSFPTERETSTLSDLCGNNRVPKLFRNPIAETPMLIGLFRPTIILPERDYTDAQLYAVLQHELTHLRRKDVLVKWLSILACAVHWFNPLVWIVRREIDRACELSCDEAVIRNLDKDGKQNYGDTLIYVAADAKTPHAVLSTTMCEEKKALKERLGAIMKSKKHTRIAIVLSAVLIITACGTAIALGSGRANAQEYLNATGFTGTIYIDLRNGNTGENVIITDASTINTITNYFTANDFKRENNSTNSTGWTYHLELISVTGDIIADIMVMSANNISFGDYFYSSSNNTAIDVVYIDSLFDFIDNSNTPNTSTPQNKTQKYTLNGSYSLGGESDDLNQTRLSFDVSISGEKSDIENIDTYDVLINTKYMNLLLENNSHGGKVSDNYLTLDDYFHITGSLLFDTAGMTKEMIDAAALFKGIKIIDKAGNEFDLYFNSKSSGMATNDMGTNDTSNHITVKVEPENISVIEIPNYVSITIKNLSDNLEYRGSYHYAIEYYDGTDWVNIVAPAVIEEELVIDPSSVFEMNFVQLMPNTYNYTAGKYRVVYDRLYGEFTIS